MEGGGKNKAVQSASVRAVVGLLSLVCCDESMGAYDVLCNAKSVLCKGIKGKAKRLKAMS